MFRNASPLAVSHAAFFEVKVSSSLLSIDKFSIYPSDLLSQISYYQSRFLFLSFHLSQKTVFTAGTPDPDIPPIAF